MKTSRGQKFRARRPNARVAVYLILALVVCAVVTATAMKVLKRSVARPEVPEHTSSVTLPHLTLSEAERTYLWDAEHHGTLLSCYGFGPWKESLLAGEVERLHGFLTEGFRGFVPLDERTAGIHTHSLAASRTREVLAWQEHDADGFLAWLFERRERIAEDAAIAVSLMTFAPVDRSDLAGRWRARCRLRLWGKTATGGPIEFMLFLNLLIDAPGPALEEKAWVHECRVEQIEWCESELILMHDRATEWGLNPAPLHDNWLRTSTDNLDPNPGGLFVCDYNRDGFLDVLVTDRSLPNGFIMYRGAGPGRYEDVTADLGIPPVPGSPVAVADLDGDGWEDLVLGPNHVFRNLLGTEFADVSSDCNLGSFVRETGDALSGTGVVLADYDRDGRVDLYLTRSSSKVTEGSWVDGRIGDHYENQLLRNVGEWQFEDVTDETGTRGGERSTFTAVWFDADNDRDPDLYVIHEFGNGLLLINQDDGTFCEQALIEGPADFGSMGAHCGDINNDGWLDLYIGNMYSKSGNRVMSNLTEDAYEPLVMKKLRRMVAGSQLYVNGGGMEFVRRGVEYDVFDIGWSYGPALADLDNDGYLDIYATCGFISRSREKPDG